MVNETTQSTCDNVMKTKNFALYFFALFFAFFLQLHEEDRNEITCEFYEKNKDPIVAQKA